MPQLLALEAGLHLGEGLKAGQQDPILIVWQSNAYLAFASGQEVDYLLWAALQKEFQLAQESSLCILVATASDRHLPV